MRPRAAAVICIVVLSLLTLTPDLAQSQSDPTITPRWMKSGHYRDVQCIALSHDGQIAVTSDDTFAKVWNVETGNLLWTLPVQDNADAMSAFAMGVNSVVITPDGNTIVTGGGDNTVKLWNLADGSLIQTFPKHMSDITGVAISPDGAKMVSTYREFVEIWNLANGELLHTLPVEGSGDIGHPGRIRSVVISPDGRYIVSGGDDNSIKVWTLADGRLLRTLSDPNAGIPISSSTVLSLAFLPDTNLVISGGSKVPTNVWRISDGAVVKTLTGIPGSVWSIAVSPNGQEIVTGSENTYDTTGVFVAGVIGVWDFEDGTPLRTLPDSSEQKLGHPIGVRCLAISQDGTRIVSGGRSGEIIVWRASDGAFVKRITEHSGAVRSLAVSPDGSRIVSGSWDRTARIWDTSSGTRTGITPDQIPGLQNYFAKIWSIAIDPDNSRMAVGRQDGSTDIWNLTDTSLVQTLPVPGTDDLGHPGAVSGVQYAPDGETLVSCGLDSTIKIWRISDNTLLRTLRVPDEDETAPQGIVLSVTLSQDGETIISAGNDNMVRVWNLADGSLVRSLPVPGSDDMGHTADVWGVAITRDGSKIVSGSADRTIKVWRASDGLLLRTISSPSDVYALAISPDGRVVVTGGKDGRLNIWDISNGNLTHTLYGHPFEVQSVAISLDGGTIVSGGPDATVIAWTVDPPFADWTILPVNNSESSQPASATLHPSAPNPFNATTTIRFSLSQPMHAQLDVFNVAGQHVTTLVDKSLPVGFHEVKWNASDSHSKSVGSGVYIYRLITPAGVAVGKTTLLR
jgi:WD40 repeat protein